MDIKRIVAAASAAVLTTAPLSQQTVCTYAEEDVCSCGLCSEIAAAHFSQAVSADAEKAYSKGDVNDDGYVTSADASKILNLYAELSVGGTPNEPSSLLLACDVDGDGFITSFDASLVLAFYAYTSAGGNCTIDQFVAGDYTPITTTSTSTTTTTTTTTSTTTTVSTTFTTTTTVLPPPSTFSVKFLDVGQADAALIQCDGHYMLIDGGNAPDSNLIYSVLERDNIRHLDIVVGTHAHEDHIGGIPGAFQLADADLVLSPVTSYDSKAFTYFKKAADEKGGGLKIPSVGDTYTLGSADISILGVNTLTDTNNTSIVLKIVYGDTSFLFTGDAEREAEQIMLDNGIDPSATVLKVGHHGSYTSTSYTWLNAVMPKYAVISTEKGNSYGHPHDEVLSRLRDADVQIFRTDLMGDIVAVSDGKNVTFTTDRHASPEELLIPGDKLVTTTAPAVTTTTTVAYTPVTTTTTTAATDPYSITYVLNTNTMKFHKSTCSSVDTISKRNYDTFTGSRDDLIAMEYSPCKTCKP